MKNLDCKLLGFVNYEKKKKFRVTIFPDEIFNTTAERHVGTIQISIQKNIHNIHTYWNVAYYILSLLAM